MTREEHLSDLREQYAYLNRKYLEKLQAGESLKEIIALKETIATLLLEIEVMENDIKAGRK